MTKKNILITIFYARGGNVVRCKIRRKRISRGVQCEEPCHKKNHIILSCFQSQNTTSEQLYVKKNAENGKCHVSVQCSTKQRYNIFKITTILKMLT